MLEETFQPYSNRGCKCRRKRKGDSSEYNWGRLASSWLSRIDGSAWDCQEWNFQCSWRLWFCSTLSGSRCWIWRSTLEEKTIPSSTLRSSPSTSWSFFYAGERRGSIAPPVFSGKCYVQLCPPTSTSPELQSINERRDEPDLNAREDVWNLLP